MTPVHPLTASTTLGRLSTRFRSVFTGIFDHSSRSAFVRSHTDVGWEGLAFSLPSYSSQRCSIGLMSGLCAGQSSLSTPNSLIHVLLCALMHSYVGTGRGHPQTFPSKLGAWNCPTSLGMLKHSDFLLYKFLYIGPLTGSVTFLFWQFFFP